MKTIIYTSFPCLIKFNGEQEHLTRNENLIFEEPIEKFDVYPTERGRISFEVDLSLPESHFYRIIERENKRLIFLLEGLYAENGEICEFEYNGCKSVAELYPQKVVFSNSQNKKIIHLTKKYKTFHLGNIKFIDYCILKNWDEDCTLIAYNAKKNTAKVFNAKDIIEEEEGFSVVSSAFGYTSITQHLYVDEDGLKIKEKEFSPSSTVLGAPQETLSFQFLNAVKFGDFDKCLSMLAPELSDRMSTDALKAYFGNISYFYMISPYSAYAISNNKNVIYEFQVSGNKISEISSE